MFGLIAVYGTIALYVYKKC